MKHQDSQLVSPRIKRYANTSFLELQEINRSPIHGYEDVPLQSLEEATERIIAFVPGLMDNVAKAKLNCNRDSTILTLDESAAIYLYTMPIPLYSTLNKALRAENREELKPWLAFLKLFMYALKKLPSNRTVVWRAISENITSTLTKDRVHTWWSVNSCSTNPNILSAYYGRENTIISIRTLHGKNISSLSAFPIECEVVLPPGTCIRVQSDPLIIDDQYFIIQLEEMAQLPQESAE
ncbi:unnamed protein product [Rotaria socialis]|uniref:NAD(P)(+)--arginine ADP-ribosyltransferase n=1 Tax=Rotaria socialis TaxID=392032 RepID=A0A818IC68_9BILA|nr:unnamed protein product [Rotaria socialis]CAF4646039.1 unnamed protein product [Rotaria socialis]